MSNFDFISFQDKNDPLNKFINNNPFNMPKKEADQKRNSLANLPCCCRLLINDISSSADDW